jgi:phosphoribosylanthranilate isomerase
VFVNSSAEAIEETAQRLKLDWVQLHGDEPPELLATLAGRSVLKAFRMGEGGWSPIDAYLADCQQRGCKPAAILVDAAQPGEFGGTGQTIDWKLIAEGRSHLAGIPLVLAGGLTPFNVTEAISTARPNAVDVASGVESKPGVKDLMLIRAFITSAKKALDAHPAAE